MDPTSLDSLGCEWTRSLHFRIGACFVDESMTDSLGLKFDLRVALTG